MDQPKNPALDAAALLDITNPRATEQPLLFHERRQSIAANRRIPTTKRERRLQELAIAACDEWELRRKVDATINREYAAADGAQQAAEAAAEQAVLEAKNPIIAAFNKQYGAKLGCLETESIRARRVFKWALEQGILPAGTTDTPSTEAQYFLLARWKNKDQQPA